MYQDDIVMNRIEQERRTVRFMIELYCRKKEGNKALCDDCRSLIKYADQRLLNCPFGENKGFCSKCKVHCYHHAMRERIREVMRFSGPRMIIYSPLMAIRHILSR